MEFNLRKATKNDLPSIMVIIDSAKAYLRAQGSPQWQNGYGPNEAGMAEIIEDGVCFVLVTEQDEVAAVAGLISGVDPVYEAIEGKWNTDYKEYVAIHRVAISPDFRGQGLASKFIAALITESQNQGFHDIRIDTFPENKPMIKTSEKAGFKYTGMVHFPIPEGQRVAYQLLV